MIKGHIIQKELDRKSKDLGVGSPQLLTSQAAFSEAQLSHLCTSEIMTTGVFRTEGSIKETIGQGCYRPWHRSSILEAPLHSLDAGLWGTSWQGEAGQHLRMLRAWLVTNWYWGISASWQPVQPLQCTPAACQPCVMFFHVPADEKRQCCQAERVLNEESQDMSSGLSSTSYLANYLTLTCPVFLECWKQSLPYKAGIRMSGVMWVACPAQHLGHQ